MESWDDYRLLLAVYRQRTLRGTARVLGLNHATLARRIERINQASPCTIFEKRAMGLVVTEFGGQLLETAHVLEGAINNSEKNYQWQSPLSGDISLSLPPAVYEYLLFDDIQQFAVENPTLNLSINTGYNFANLNKQEADIVIRAAKDPGDSFVGHRLFPISLGFYANPEYLAKTPPHQYTWITSPDKEFVHNILLKSPYPDAKINYTIDDLVVRHKAAANGFGMIIGAKYLAEKIEGLEPFSDVVIPYYEMWVLTHDSLKELPRIKCCMQFLLQALRNKSASIV